MKDIWEARFVLGILDVIAGIMMVWAFQRITTIASLRTPQARWALFRRCLYGFVAVALFGLGVERLFGEYPADMIECIFQGVLLFYVMIFPVLRAFGMITQDFYLNGDLPWKKEERRPAP
jgi:hypothetical protein